MTTEYQPDRPSCYFRRAFSLLEVLAVVTILGIVAALVIPRFAGSTEAADRNACFVNQGDIEIQAHLWRRNNGVWPDASLNDMGGNVEYFPEGLPTCPVDGSAYTIDATGRVVRHTH